MSLCSFGYVSLPSAFHQSILLNFFDFVLDFDDLNFQFHGFSLQKIMFFHVLETRPFLLFFLALLLRRINLFSSSCICFDFQFMFFIRFSLFFLFGFLLTASLGINQNLFDRCLQKQQNINKKLQGTSTNVNPYELLVYLIDDFRLIAGLKEEQSDDEDHPQQRCHRQYQNPKSMWSILRSNVYQLSRKVADLQTTQNYRLQS